MVELKRLSPRLQTSRACEPFQSWEIAKGERWANFYRLDAGILVQFPGYADFELSADGRQVACAPVPDVAEATIEHLYLNQVLPLALGCLGKLVFHASAVEINGGAVAFHAESGRGKSSLAVAFAIDGNPFLTDDALILEGNQGGFDVQSSHPSLRLWEDSRERLIVRNATDAPATSYAAKARLLAGDGLPHCGTPRRLLASYFLGEGIAAEIVFRKLGPGEALIAWASNSFLLDIEDRDLISGHFDRIAALANRVKCFALDYPRRYELLPDVLAAIHAHVRSLGPGHEPAK